MKKALIKIAYKQIIDASSQEKIERQIFNDSYNEFLVQSQSFSQNGKYKTWQEIKTNFPKAISNVPFKISFAITQHVNKYNNKIPALSDTLGIIQLPFVDYRFDIIESDVINKSSHKVSIIYMTNAITLVDIIHDHLLLTMGDKIKELHGKTIDTFLIKISPNLSIFNYTETINIPVNNISCAGSFS